MISFTAFPENSMKQNQLLKWCTFICIIFISAAQPAFGQKSDPNGEGVASKPTIDERIKKYLNDHGIVRFGINTDLVFTSEYDTGFGFGMKLPKKLLAPTIEITTSANFWGASNDTLDVSYFGLEESLTIHKYPVDKIEVFSGISLGYYGKLTSQEITQGGSAYTKDIQQNSFSGYVTIGLVHKKNQDQSFFLQLKHWILEESKEIHLLFGIYFH